MLLMVIKWITLLAAMISLDLNLDAYLIHVHPYTVWLYVMIVYIHVCAKPAFI